MTNLGTFTWAATTPARRYSKHGIDRQEYNQRAREFCLRGEALSHAKLTEEMVRQIRREYRRFCRINGATGIAKRLGLHRRTVENVLNYETWGHVR